MQVAAAQLASKTPPIPYGGNPCQGRTGPRARHDSEANQVTEPSELITAVAARQDQAAFAALFELYAGRIKAWLMKMGANAELAEDIAQETLLAIWNKAPTFDPSRASASAWIFAIARNLRIDRLRRDQRSRMHLLYEMVEPEEPERPDGAFDFKQRGERVRAALDQLPDEQVVVVQLSFFEDHPHSEISERLGIPLGTVKSRLRLAMGRLRESLGELR